MFDYAVSFLVALTISAGILPAIIRGAHRIGAVDRPGGRRAHRGEIPRLGGIAIYLGFVGGVGAAILLAGRAASLSEPTSDFPWFGVGLGATVIFGAGLLDDMWQLRPQTKFLCQVIAAGLAVSYGVRMDILAVPFGIPIDLGVWSPLLTLVWLLVIINAINLIDGLDGLAGGIALIVTTTMASLALAAGQFGVVSCAVALAGALVGFLRYNFDPAKIFMGDGGSQFLGFMLAIISIRGSAKGATAIALLLPLFVLGLPLTDLVTTIARRAFRGVGKSPAAVLRCVSSADREHLHHNLLDLGLTPRRAVLSLYLLSSLFALAGYLSVARNGLKLAAMTLLVSVACVAIIKYATIAGKPRPAAERTESS